MAGKWRDHLRTCSRWRLLFIATACGIVTAVVSVVLGISCVFPIVERYFASGKETTEWGDAVLGIYVFLTFGSTGLIAGFSGIYGVARRRGYAALAITFTVLGINVLGFFVPTGGYALLPFYASIVIGLGLAGVFLILRSAQA